MSMLRPSPSSSPVARPSQISYVSPDPHYPPRTSNNNPRNIAVRRSSSSSDRGNYNIAGSTTGSVLHARSAANTSTTSAFSNITSASPPLSAARPKRARASPDLISSPHPTRREFSSPRIPSDSQSHLASHAAPGTKSSAGTSVHNSSAVNSPLAVARTQSSSVFPHYVSAGTQYTPPDYPPTSLRSSLHPENRAAAARAAATALLHQLSSSGSSSLSSSSSSSSAENQNPQRHTSSISQTRPPLSATAAEANPASQRAPPSRSLAEQQTTTAAAVDVAASSRAITPPNVAGPGSGVARLAEPPLRVTQQATTASSPRNVASTVAAGPAAGPTHEPSASSSSHHTAATGTATTSATAAPDAPAPSNQGSTRSYSAQVTASQIADTDIRVQLLPAEYSQCDASILARLIADMLMELIRFNDQIPLQDGHLTRFHSRAPPSISVHDYLARLTFHATLSPPILLSMVFLIDKLCLLFPAFTINSLTVHRFLITAATVASKGLSDSFWTNQTYARCGGVTVRELAMLEIELLSRIQWRIVPRPEALFDYYVNLVARNPAYQIQQAEVTNPGEDEGNEMDVDGQQQQQQQSD